jgi:hypothetical protein
MLKKGINQKIPFPMEHHSSAVYLLRLMNWREVQFNMQNIVPWVKFLILLASMHLKVQLLSRLMMRKLEKESKVSLGAS